MTKLLAFVFWDIRRFFEAMYDDGHSDFKALAVIVCTELLGIMAIVATIEAIVGYQIIPTSKPSFLILGGGLSIGITALNCYLLTYREKWARFKAEFENYSARVKLFGNLMVLSVICAVFVAAIVSGGLVHRIARTGPGLFH